MAPLTHVPDIDEKTAVIELTDTKLSFKGKNETNEYELDLEFLHEIDANSEESKYGVKPRHVSFYLIKKEEESWTRLLKDRAMQKTNVKCDFDKWVDSDDEGDGKDFNLDGMGGMGGPGPGGMGGMGGPGGPGGMGGMDMARMMEQMKGMQAGAGPSFDGEESDSDDNSGSDLEYDDSDDEENPENKDAEKEAVTETPSEDTKDEK